MIKTFCFLVLHFLVFVGFAQITYKGNVVNEKNEPLEFVNVYCKQANRGVSTDQKGQFELDLPNNDSLTLVVSSIGFNKKEISLSPSQREVAITLKESFGELETMVVTGTMKEVSKLESPVAVEVYSDQFFKANPTPSVFESVQQINGIRPQLNCNVCNTGDIHINGLEGPYTSILIDGMPIVSGLSTVYGLTGIPQALIERMEVIKGPSSTLYGSEAVGGVINIITKKVSYAPVFTANISTTSWLETNTDLGFKWSNKKASTLLGINYFKYGVPIDNNNDDFTDVTLQDRISIFNKWNFHRKDNKLTSLAVRYNYEDRWGGEMDWDKQFRGGDSVYGESIYTNRWEILGVYELPIEQSVKLSVSANGHYQNSVYGDTWYLANQHIAFGQLVWDESFNSHHVLSGISYRYTQYDDNTPATSVLSNGTQINAPSVIHLPGVFVQDEWKFNNQNKLLSGIRYNYNQLHGSIWSPRLNYKWNTKNKYTTVRIGVGNGYRVVNVFSEDHAALTGAREVIIEEKLMPETSWNANLNFVQKWSNKKNLFLTLDGSIYYTYFDNRIVADYDTDPNKIIYGNLEGYAESKGIALSIDAVHSNGLNANIGATLQEVSLIENGQRELQLLTEQVSFVWRLGYSFKKGWSIDYTGKTYGPMKLPLISDLDQRNQYSPWFSLQNIKVAKAWKNFEFYGGVKNLLNYTPPANSIARAFDPFDKNVTFDNEGQAVATPNNPQALTFDPSYVFAPNQGIRFFFGLYTIE